MPVGNEGAHTISGLTVSGGLAITGQDASSGNLSRTVYVTGDSIANRDQFLRQARSIYTESYPFTTSTGSATMVSGTIYAAGLPLAAGDVVSSLTFQVATAGASFSGIGFKVALYTPSLALAAVSGDVSASILTAGNKTAALLPQGNGQPYIAPASGQYYACLLGIATTMPALVRNVNGLFLVFNGVPSAGTMAAQTDMPGTLTLSNVSNFGFWIAGS